MFEPACDSVYFKLLKLLSIRHCRCQKIKEENLLRTIKQCHFEEALELQIAGYWEVQENRFF